MRRLAPLAVALTLALAATAHAAPGGDAIVVDAPFSVAGPGDGSAVATCPAGRRVVGGGVGTTGGIGSRVQVSGPLDESGSTAGTTTGDVARSWSASVKNLGTATRGYKVFALCSQSSDATIAEAPLNLGSTDGGATATCPAGRRAVGGGIGTTAANLSTILQVSGPLDETGSTAGTTTGDIARSWFAFVSNIGDPRTYKVFALCSATSDATVAEAAFTAQGEGIPGQATAGCPSGRRVVGGGVGTTAETGRSDLSLSGPLDETGATANTATGDTARSWFAHVVNLGDVSTYKVLALCATDDLTAGPNAPGGGGPGGSGAGGTGGGGVGGVRSAAKLEVARAAVDRVRRRLDVFAPISRLASGVVQVSLLAGGRTTRFSAPVDPVAGRVRVSRSIPVGQARAGTGIVTLSYRGDVDTQPQVVRLRAASVQARLAAARPVIRDGRLVSGGGISRLARGVVRTQLLYTTQAGLTRSLEYSAPVGRGAYRLNQVLPRGVLEEIGRRRGVVHSYVLFTGYGAARMRGEMRSFEVLGDPAGPS